MQEVVEQLLALLRGMWQRRWIGLGVTWVTAIIGAIIVFRLPDKYEASARVYVDTQSMLQPLMAGMAVTPDAGQQVAILSRILLSRPNLEKIIRKSDLDTSAGRNAADLVDETVGSLNISRAGGDNLYTIAFRYPDGRKARDVVQAALSTFIEQIKDARLELRVAEQTRDGIRKQLEEQTQRGPAATGRRVAGVPELDNRINEQKRQLDELLRKYTDQHPDVVSTKRLLIQLLEDRKREIEVRSRAAESDPGSPLTGDPVAQQLKVALNDSEANLTAVRARLGEYEARYNQLRSSAETLPKIDMELTQLDRDYGIQKRQYESLVGRRETASLTGKLEDAGVAEFRIIDPPRVTPNPVAPNRLLLLGVLVAVSLFAGLATSWLVSQIRPTFHDGRTLREVAQRPLLGMISMLPTHSLHVVRRRAALLFAGGVSGLVASYGAAFAFLLLTTSGS